MHLTVFGASGRIGRLVVQQALDADHQVTAVVRDASRLDLTHPSLELAVRPDVTRAEALADVVHGSDAVMSGLGAARRSEAGIAAEATAAIAEAMSATGVRRLVVVSAAPVGDPGEGDGWFTRKVVYPLLDRIFGPLYDDLRAMESLLAASDLDWTAVRPPFLTDGPFTGTYRTAIGGAVAHGSRVSRADVAAAMLAALDDAATVGQPLGVAG